MRMQSVISIFGQDAAWTLLPLTLVAISLWAAQKIVSKFKLSQTYIGDSPQHPKVSRSEKRLRISKDTTVLSTSAWASVGEIKPLKDFDYRKVEPQRMFKFNPKYFLTMGLQKTDINGIIHIDRLYAERMEARQELIREWPGSLACLDSGVEMVTEFYEFLMQKFLPERYPTIFQLNIPNGTILNQITKDLLPVTAPTDPYEALRIINRNVEEDFLMLLPAPGSDGYSLQAFIFAYPVGFDPQSKLGMKLREVHQPVPHFNEKLALSMDRYFSKLEPGNVKWRSNWALATSDKLCVRGAYHLYEGQEPREKDTEFDLDECRVRCEQQTVFALPKTGAKILSVHLYLYRLQELKDLGVGPEMITAIDGLDQGNAPGVHRYKRAVVWGDRVKEFLRS